MYENKKLVYICNSIERLKLLDKLNFKDNFNGEVYIVSDDRYMTVYKEILDYISNEATNENLKRAKFVSLKNDIIPYVIPKMSLHGYEEDFKKLLFLATSISPIYFCRDSEDITLIVEDDCVLFKNPYEMMTELKTSSTYAFPATGASNEKIKSYFNCIGENSLEELDIDTNNESLQDAIYKRYGKLIGQATTVWTYLPKLPEQLSKFFLLPSTIRNININRKRGSKLYHFGFAVTLEFFFACVLLAAKAKAYTDNEIIIQDRSKEIYKAKDIAENKVVGYHYTVINDEYVFEFLPFLLEHGYQDYKLKNKDYIYTKKNKFQYLDTELTNGFSENGKFRKTKPMMQFKRRRLF